MKFIQLTLLTLLNLPLIAVQFNTTNNENSKEIYQSASYQNALNVFESKKYNKAFTLFAKLNEQYPNNGNVDFYYGRSAFELQNYEYAFTSFDRILINTPDNNRVRAELARTLMMMKSYKEAKKEFQKILILPIPINVRNNIEKFIKIIDSKEKNYSLNQVAIFGFGWDDNINNNTYENVTRIGDLSLNNDTEKVSDTHYSALLMTSLIVPNKTNNKITWESTTIAFAKEQIQHHENDIFLLSITSGIGYTNKKFKNLLSLTYDHVWVGGDQTLYLYGVSDSLKYQIFKKHLLTTNIKFKHKKMIKKEDEKRNSTLKELSFNYLIPLTNKKDKIQFSTSYISERKDSGARVDISKGTIKYGISYNKNFFDSYDLTLGYELEKVKYKEMSSFLPKRDDESRNISVKLSKKINKKNIISLELSNINTNSNINVYTYKKKYANLSYIHIF